MTSNRMPATRQLIVSVVAVFAYCAPAVSGETPKASPLSFKYDNGTAADITIGRYTDTLGKKEGSTAVPIACKGKSQQAGIAPVQGQAYVYCSFPMGDANPVAYEENQPMGYQVVTLGQMTDGKFTPAIRFGMVDDDRSCAQDKASYVPGMFDGTIEYYGMYARPGSTYDFKMKLDLEKRRAQVWVAGRGDDEWFPLANNATLMNPVTAINAVQVEQLPKAPGVENLVVQTEPWSEGEALRPNPLAKANRLIGLAVQRNKDVETGATAGLSSSVENTGGQATRGTRKSDRGGTPGKGFKVQQMKSFWRDADRHVTVARTPNAERGWWLGFPDIVQTGPTSLVADYVDGAGHGGGGWLWAKHSNDLGRTWTDPVVVSRFGTNSPRLQKLRDGSLLALSDIYGEPKYPCVFFRSTDGGHTWTQAGKLDPIAAGGPESCVPSRIVEMADGAWLLVASHCPGEAWHIESGEQLHFYRSADQGKTWSYYSALIPPPPLSLSEPSIVPLPDGRWLMVAREGSGYIPGVRSYSSDQGKTWSTPEELPFVVNGRTCAALLKDGRMLFTFRNHNGTPDLWAWAADADEPTRPLVHGTHINDRTSVGLNTEGLVIDGDGRCGQFTNYRFRPPDGDQSRIDVTVEVKVLANAGRAATLSVPFVGKLRFFPDKVQFDRDPALQVPVSKDEFHAYRIVGEGEKVTLFIDGREVLAKDKLSRRTVPQPWSAMKLSPYALEFGNEPIDDAAAAFDWVPESVRKESAQPEDDKPKSPPTAVLKTITPAMTGCSVWRRFEARYDDPKAGTRTVSWSAAGGEFPDQYQLDRLVEINGSIAGWDQGYSGWVQLEDGRILILNYTDDTARWNRGYPNGGTSWIRGTYVSPDELPSAKSSP